MSGLMQALDAVNGVIWADWVLYVVLGVGLLFTIWSGFCQYRAVTHGVQVIRGVYDEKDDPGAINHFQALSAALSATVGLGNIGGVAVAIALGGPGAVFWMWVIGLVGMALKTTEVTLSLIYRNTDNPDEPHGGPMYVAAKGFAEKGLAGVGKVVGGIFCVTLLISAITGGNMFQAWNVAEVTHAYFGVPQVATGIVLAILVGAVILGGIKRIGNVAGRLVPAMCILYLVAAVYVIILNIGQIPEMLALIVRSAFSDAQGQGAFLGGSAGYAFLWGMKRALFSSEAGQGSSPIAHSAARTSEPVREAVVAGLEPFIDTIVVCTLTALVILSTGIWNRDYEIRFDAPATMMQTAEGKWTILSTTVTMPEDAGWRDGDELYTVISGIDAESTLGKGKVTGALKKLQENKFSIVWNPVDGIKTDAGTVAPKLEAAEGAYFTYQGATLTAKAFDATTPGLGMWLVSLAAWLFAISTMISWSYYGEQGIVFLMGDKAVLPYRLIYCALIVVACVPALIKTDADLDALTALGTGVMLWANIPIMLIFGTVAMRAYKDYMGKLSRGEFKTHQPTPPNG